MTFFAGLAPICDTCGGTLLVTNETRSYGYPCPECHPNPTLRELGATMREALANRKTEASGPVPPKAG